MQPCSVTTKVLSFMIRERMRLDEGIIQDRHEGRRDEGCKNTTIDNKNMEEGRGYGQHLATPKHTAEQKGWRKVVHILLILQSS